MKKLYIALSQLTQLYQSELRSTHQTIDGFMVSKKLWKNQPDPLLVSFLANFVQAGNRVNIVSDLPVEFGTTLESWLLGWQLTAAPRGPYTLLWHNSTLNSFHEWKTQTYLGSFDWSNPPGQTIIIEDEQPYLRLLRTFEPQINLFTNWQQAVTQLASAQKEVVAK